MELHASWCHSSRGSGAENIGKDGKAIAICKREGRAAAGGTEKRRIFMGDDLDILVEVKNILPKGILYDAEPTTWCLVATGRIVESTYTNRMKVILGWDPSTL